MTPHIFANRRASGTFFFMMLAAVLMWATPAIAQTTNGDLSGTVTDNTGARIPGTGVTLTNQKSHDRRTTSSNGEGVFTFSAVPTGNYTLEFRHEGFKTVTAKNIEIHPGDQQSLSDTVMPVGTSDVSVTVTADSTVVANGERSELITSEDIKHLSTEGRDVTELLKILPGFAQAPGGATNTTGLSNAAPGSNLIVGPGSGLGNYTANGAPAAGAGLISDGSNIQDPGDAGASTQNVNMDMVEEVKVQTSNFGADSVKGPIVLNAVGKSGGADYHGSLFVHARTYQLNSQDWLTNHFGYQKPNDRYLYPGANLGGPIKIPGTNFNHDKKLTFWVGAEDYAQRNTFSGGTAQSAIRLSTVPTAGMRTGDFSNAELAKMFNVDPATLVAQCTGSGTLSAFTNFCLQPSGTELDGVTPITNGQIGAFDPGAASYLKLFPLPNRAAQPTGPSQISDGLNRQDIYLVNADNYQARSEVDYAQSDRTKYRVTYNVERGNTYNPFTLYYNPNYNQGIVQDPSLIESTINSNTASLNVSHTFNPTLTNETFAALSFYVNPYFPKNEALQTKTALNYPYGGLFPTGSNQIPMLGYGQGLPLYQSPDFTFGSIFARKFSVDFGDNVSKTWRNNITKIGFYFERAANNQRSAYNPTQGTIAEYGNYASIPNAKGAGGSIPTTNNVISNFFYGFANSYGQQNSLPIQDMNFLTIDGYISNSWKVTKKLTLDGGVRFDHQGPWTDSNGLGLAVWEPALYANEVAALNGAASSTTFPGIHWHGNQSNLPISGTTGRVAFVEPRAGFAYDFFGNGRTTIRGGWGMYVAHDSWNDYSSALSTSQGSFIEYLFNTTLACASAFGGPASAVPAYCTSSGSATNGLSQGNIGVTAVAANDTQQPTSYTYSLTLDQSLPWKMALDIAYTGSESAHLIVSANGANLQNVNTIPLGGMFRPDPNPTSVNFGQVAPPDSFATPSDFAPFPYYTNVNVIRHGLHTNYNGLQAQLTKRSGHALFNVNYTYSRALGDRATDGGGSVPDGTNQRNDTGVLAFDRTNIFNASYTLMTGTVFHGNRLVGGFVNGWEFSGITNYVSGPNIQAATSPNFSLTAFKFGPNLATDSKTFLGTPNITLQPGLSCNPSSGLAKNQFINGACFTLPTPGTNGPYDYPYAHGPGFFNSDLSAQKGFHLAESREIIFRFSAFNFINHPLTSLVGASAQPLQLSLTPTSPNATAANPGAVMANGAFGFAQYKEGRRVSEVELRFNF